MRSSPSAALLFSEQHECWVTHMPFPQIPRVLVSPLSVAVTIYSTGGLLSHLAIEKGSPDNTLRLIHWMFPMLRVTSLTGTLIFLCSDEPVRENSWDLKRSPSELVSVEELDCNSCAGCTGRRGHWIPEQV